MTPLEISLLSIIAAQFGLLWYRIGRLDGKLDQVCRRLDFRNGRRPEGS